VAIDFVVETMYFRTQLGHLCAHFGTQSPHVSADIGHQGGVIFHPAFQVRDPLVQALHCASPDRAVTARLYIVVSSTSCAVMQRADSP
jgi:hypothetical protein